MSDNFKDSLRILESYIIEYDATHKGKPHMYHMYYRDYLHYASTYGQKTCLLYQVGDFYESYGFLDKSTGITIGNYLEIRKDTNIKIAKENITPTYTSPQYIGFPRNSIDKHIEALIHNQYTVVVFDQFKVDNGKNDTEYERKWVRTVSPSTYLEDTAKEFETKNVLCLYLDGIRLAPAKDNNFHVGYVNIDITTGDSEIGELYSSTEDNKKIMDEIYRVIKIYNPCELVIKYNKITDGEKILEYLDQWFSFSLEKSYCKILDTNFLKQEYQEEVLFRSFPRTLQSVFDYLEITHLDMGTIALVSVLDHLYNYDHYIIEKIKNPKIIKDDQYLVLENNTLAQLQVYTPVQASSSVRPSLVKYIDYTVTPVGSRELVSRLMKPLYQTLKPSDPPKYSACYPQTEIERRYDLIDELIKLKSEEPAVYTKLQQNLRNIGDLSRLQRRIHLGIIKMTELSKLDNYYLATLHLLNLLKRLPESQILKSLCPDKTLKHSIMDLRKFYTKHFDFDVNEIKSDVDEELDATRIAHTKSQTYINTVVTDLNTFIGGTLKGPVSTVYNDKEGQYIRITPNGLATLKRKLTNISTDITLDYFNSESDEYIEFKMFKSFYKGTSTKIKNLSTTIQVLKDKLTELHCKVYKELVKKLAVYSNVYTFFVNFVGSIDVAMSSSIVAIKFGYCRPQIKMKDKGVVTVSGIRNPIGEQIWNEIYVTNDVDLSRQSLLLYGINSVGKSSVMKAMALNIVMAQAGMYTSATSFVYSPFKNMFTRVGNLDSYRYSSFQMECLDIRSIIRRSNEHTFILLDELTSSTEHLSALSISYALIKRLHSKKSTFMFATHLTELYDILMENPLERVMIKHLDAFFDTDKGEIVFNRKLKDGYSKQLYGIEVAKSMLYDDKDFIEDAFSIREKLRPKFSHFNTKALMIRCDVCGSTDQLEEHHINHQAVADKDGVIKNEQGVFHKNTRGNLCCLCNKCHMEHHHGSLKIMGWQTTSSGICLNYSKN